MGQEWDRVVYISSLDEIRADESSLSELGHWTGHVESYEDDYYEQGRPGPDGDSWLNVNEAIAWGRERAPIVLVRIGNTHYSAGAVHAEDDEDHPLPLWPPGGVHPT